jgi:adenylate cyclase
VGGSQRRLAAILAADMAGFSRLIGRDEEGTLARQKALRHELFDPAIREHHGRVVKSTGDGLLAEFGSAVDAVRCAVRIQSAIRDGEVAAAAGEPAIAYRMGINVGDIVIDGDDIFGDGVNIAARLESLADPGGICISRGVFDHVRGKVDALFDDLGERELKNIAQPVQVFQLRSGGEQPLQKERREPSPRYPSIAVLPIANISGSSDLDPFAAGLTEDLTAALARIPELLVTPSGLAEEYRGKAVDVRQAARRLGVDNILQGSIQGSAKRLRVTVQLIDGAAGNYLWAGRYENQVEDILALQDEIVRKALIEVRVKLTSGDLARLSGSGTRNLDAWLLYGQATEEWAKFTRESNFRATELFHAAHQGDPEWPRPLGGLAAAYREAAIRGWTNSPQQDLAKATAFAERATELGPNDPFGYVHLGYCRLTNGATEAGIALMERALDIAPNDISTLSNLAWNLPRVGQETRALALFARARKLRPIPSNTMNANMGFVHHLMGQHEQAIQAMNECLSRAPLADAHIRLAAIYADLGRMDEARAEIAHVLAREPDATIKEYTGNLPLPNDARREWYAGLLRTAGLPDN